MKRLLTIAVSPFLLAAPVLGAPVDDVDAEAFRAIEPVFVDVRMDASAGGTVVTADGRTVDLDQLSSIIRYKVSLNPNQPVRILADDDLPWPAVAQVISACNRAGAKNVSLSRRVQGQDK